MEWRMCAICRKPFESKSGQLYICINCQQREVDLASLSHLQRRRMGIRRANPKKMMEEMTDYALEHASEEISLSPVTEEEEESRSERAFEQFVEGFAAHIDSPIIKSDEIIEHIRTGTINTVRCAICDREPTLLMEPRNKAVWVCELCARSDHPVGREVQRRLEIERLPQLSPSNKLQQAKKGQKTLPLFKTVRKLLEELGYESTVPYSDNIGKGMFVKRDPELELEMLFVIPRLAKKDEELEAEFSAEIPRKYFWYVPLRKWLKAQHGLKGGSDSPYISRSDKFTLDKTINLLALAESLFINLAYALIRYKPNKNIIHDEFNHLLNVQRTKFIINQIQAGHTRVIKKLYNGMNLVVPDRDVIRVKDENWDIQRLI